MKCFYSVTQVTLDFKRYGLKKYGKKEMFTFMCDIFIMCFVLFLFFVFWVEFQRYCCCCCGSGGGGGGGRWWLLLLEEEEGGRRRSLWV
jgi:hypothetical protein